MLKPYKCAICGKNIVGYPNNAEPLVHGQCCDECNKRYVLPARIIGTKKPQVGDHVFIVKMEGEPDYTGKDGTIEHIDDAGQLHGSWGGCALIPNKDIFLIWE